MAMKIWHNNVEFDLVIARRPITMEFLYRVCLYAYNESLFSYVRNNNGEVFYIEDLGFFQLEALDPLQDITVSGYSLDDKAPTLLFSDFIAPTLGYKPELLTADEVFELYLQQSA